MKDQELILIKWNMEITNYKNKGKTRSPSKRIKTLNVTIFTLKQALKKF